MEQKKFTVNCLETVRILRSLTINVDHRVAGTESYVYLLIIPHTKKEYNSDRSSNILFNNNF